MYVSPHHHNQRDRAVHSPPPNNNNNNNNNKEEEEEEEERKKPLSPRYLASGSTHAHRDARSNQSMLTQVHIHS